VTKSHWRVRLGAEAEKDFVRILKYTADTFGERQAASTKPRSSTLSRLCTPAPTSPQAPPATKSSLASEVCMLRAKVTAVGISSYTAPSAAR